MCRRRADGRTALHAAAYSANVGVLRHLVDAGGDLRLHDNAGRSARDWAASRKESRQRSKILDYLNKAKLTALNNSTKDFLELSMHTKYAAFHVRCTPCFKKVCPLTFDNNFGKCGPMFKIVLAIHSSENSLCTHHKDFHLTCMMLLHYLVKVENRKVLLILTASSTNC